ncbi:MAG: type III pantothenate kinase [Actinobacteria bacterium]|nr:type III pantothenate kinase [Actinomycetota bacterium]
MLLAVDVGNSNTVLGIFQGDELVQHWRTATDVERTPDDVALTFQGLLAFAGLDFGHNIHGVVISSVVPPVTDTMREMVARYFPFPPLVMEPGIRTGIPLRYENPRDVGSDRIANAVAAYELHGGPAIVVDFGTATSFDVVDAAGGFVGGAIAPGIHTATDALVQKAARLPNVEILAPPTAIGRSTTSALQSGIVYGFAGLVDGVVARLREELGPDVTVVATGGLAPAVREACRSIDVHDEWLTLKGLRLIWERNTTR